MQRAQAAGLLVLLLAGCKTKVKTYGDGEFPEKLSQWGLFVGNLGELKPNEGVLPYELNTPLFSDYATKRRFVWMPAGTSAVYNDRESFEFPVGTVISKTFTFDRLIETRLLVRTQSGWYGLPYVWNTGQTEAVLEVAADPVHINYRGASFDYSIPNVNQCKGCHEKGKVMTPIGPKARNLNRGDQLAVWTRAGYLKGAPAADRAPRAAVWDDPSTGSVEARALAYLDINCGHCHRPEGPANTSGLYLTYGQADPLRLGFNKVPVSAGKGSGDLRFDVVSGHPEESILVHRMESTEPKVLMPELGRAVVHKEGVALIREWIQASRPSR